MNIKKILLQQLPQELVEGELERLLARMCKLLANRDQEVRVRAVCIVLHVGGTRCVTSNTDPTMQNDMLESRCST